MRQFPPGLADVLAAELAPLGEEIIATISREVPAYARPLEGRFGQGVRRGVEEALTRFLALVQAGPEAKPDLSTSREVYVRLGRGELRAGRSLDNLLSAYRVGARVSWRRLGDAARRAGLDPAGLVCLAEMMFAYIDGISAASAEGYAHAQFEAAGEQEWLWERLGELLLSGADPAVVEQTAHTAGVRLPDRLAAVLVPGSPDGGRARLPAACPRAGEGTDLWVFVGGLADGDGPGDGAALGGGASSARAPARAASSARAKAGAGGRAGCAAAVTRRSSLAAQLAGLGAVVGPTVPLPEVRTSVERARFAWQARAAGRLGAAADDDPLFTDDHLPALLLARDPELLDDLARRRLAPLARLPERTRGRLAETLLHWLSLHGRREQVAARLHVHPQTVRYRINQLRELFGAALEDPDSRFELELVLRAWHAGRGRLPLPLGRRAGSAVPAARADTALDTTLGAGAAVDADLTRAGLDGDPDGNSGEEAGAAGKAGSARSRPRVPPPAASTAG